MANLGEITEFIMSPELTLEVGADQYIMLQDLEIHIGRTESRDPTTAGSPEYSYGQGDNWFTATLLATRPELSTLNTLTQIDANGAMTSTAWLIKGTDVSGTAATFAATGVLRDFSVRKARNDSTKVEVDIFVRITGDTVTIS